MKKLIFTCTLLCMTLYGMSQFVPQPLNYPGPGYWPFYYSITDPDHVWVGTIHESGAPTAFSVKTTDGGDSWIFDTIPVPGVPNCISICGWDANICFFVFMETSGPSIWKTVNGGATWSNIVTTQFAGSFINFYHAFSADTGLAMGDPRDGYFEIQLTYDGGVTWTRVPSANIPTPLTDEMGVGNNYSAVGNSIWFTTNMSRCYYSTDRGQTWGVTDVFPGVDSDLGICFSTEQKGAIWNGGITTDQLVVTTDGGLTWNAAAFPSGYTVWQMSRVPGWEGGFVVTAYKMGAGMNVYFTPDLFSTILTLDTYVESNGAVKFYDAATGWLGGGESGTNEIYKFVWVLNAGGPVREPAALSILPNPSSGQALLKLPDGLYSREYEIRVTDITGRVMSRYPVTGKDYCILDATPMANGIYVVTLCSGNTPLVSQRWCVRH